MFECNFSGGLATEHGDDVALAGFDETRGPVFVGHRQTDHGEDQRDEDRGNDAPPHAAAVLPVPLPRVEHGERRATLPEDLPPDEVTLEMATKLLEQAELSDQPLGTCPETNKPIYLKVGRFGPYIMRGSMDDEEKPKNASLLKGMTPESVDFETALSFVSVTLRLSLERKARTSARAALYGRFSASPWSLGGRPNR